MSTSSTSMINLSSYGLGPGPQRITGMATGLDIDSIVSEMMLAKTQPIDKMKQQEQVLQWTRDGYRSMNTLMSTLNTAAMNLRYQYEFQAQKATTDNPSVTATANPSASSGTYTMTVHQLATSASLVSQTAIGVASNTAQALNTSGAVTLNVTGATGTKQIVIPANSSITTIASTINYQAGATGVNCSYDSATDRLYFTSTTTGANAMISISGADSASQSFLNNKLQIASSGGTTVTGTKSIAAGAVIDSTISPSSPLIFSVNGQNITITNTTTVANLQDQLAKTGLSPDVVFSQDSNGNLMLQSTGNITLANVQGSALADIGLTAGTYNASAPSSVSGTKAFDPMTLKVDSGLTGPINFTVDGATVTINNTTTYNDIQSQLTAAGLTNPVTVSIDSNHHVNFTSGATITLTDGSAGSTGKTGLQELGMSASSSGTTITGSSTVDPSQIVVDSSIASPITFQVNGTTLTLSNTTTIADLQSQLSSAGLTPSVTLSLDANNHVKLQSNGSITLTDGSAGSDGFTALQDLGLTAGTTQGNLTPSLATGTDTIVDFNGVNNIHFHTSNFLLNNINFSLTTPPAPNSSYNVNVTVSQDTDTIYNNIKAFVDAYNNTISQLNSKLSEQKYYDYPPLTDAQKAQMKDSDITLWNQKAQSGLLQGDPTLESALDQLKSFATDPVTTATTGQYKLLSDIGIAELPPGTTDAYADGGKLYIDDAKLKQAIASNPQQVINLFTNGGTLPTSNVSQPDDSQGIAERLYRISNNVINSLTGLAGTTTMLTDTSSIGLQINDLDKQIKDSESQLAGYQQQYYSQWAQIESAINNFNSQKSYLSSAFSGGSGG